MKRFFQIAAVLILHSTFSILNSNAQCPACSNPALQSSEKLEAGLDTLKKGAFRVTLNVTNGWDYQGGHEHDQGLTEERNIITVPLHEHKVDLDFVRSEISMEYTFATNWTAWLRVPYDVKMQTATIDFIEPLTDYEKESAFRNRDIHHRTENYLGISDSRLFVAHRFNGFISKKGRLDVALGTSLPIGKTEENPLERGGQGQKHMHIQFGTGTFDPLLELHYVASVSKKTSLALFTMNKYPFYENNHGFKAPFESTSGLGFGWSINKRLAARATFANFYQSFSLWEGEKDPNSGLIALNASVNFTFRLKSGLTITPGYRYPIYQKTLVAGGDTYEYGHTFLLNISYLVRKK
ncbi:MAG: hypothetical protein COA57_07460 [Flavobacteriales bacterium]|nr:MAG: hypothetical protein COA57_07460 [Flavobacteriales bacterium]